MSRRAKDHSVDATTTSEILGDERAAAIDATLADLAARVAGLEEQVRSAFTTIASYVRIAEDATTFARDEARADTERTRQLLIELMEQLRTECFARQAELADTMAALLDTLSVAG
jgi:hypothetical protein